MANFGPNQWTNQFEKNINFLNISTSLLYSLEGHFFELEYHKTPFSGLYCLEDMRFQDGGTLITRDMCFPGGVHISLGICVSQVGEHILLGICVPGRGTHITRNMCFQSSGGEQI